MIKKAILNRRFLPIGPAIVATILLPNELFLIGVVVCWCAKQSYKKTERMWEENMFEIDNGILETLQWKPPVEE